MLDRTEFTYETNHFNLFKFLWTTDAIRGDKSGSTLAWAMACCLLTPSHFLISNWPLINWSLYGTCGRPISEEVLGISLAEITRLFLRDHWVNGLLLVVVILIALLLTHYVLVTSQSHDAYLHQFQSLNLISWQSRNVPFSFMKECHMKKKQNGGHLSVCELSLEINQYNPQGLQISYTMGENIIMNI